MSKKLGISVRAKRSIAYESLEARNLLATFTATEGTSFFWGIMKPKRLRSRSNKNALSSAYGRLEARNLLATFSTGGVPSTVYVDFSDGRPAAIEINGESFENPDDTIHIEIKGYESDPNRRNYLHFRGDDFNMKLERFTGSVNGVATFEHAGDTTNFYTGDGNDTVEEGGSGYGFFGIFVDTGAGDDTFIYNGGGTFNSLNLGQLRGDLGAGDDHFIYRSDQSGYQTINGGFKEYVFSGGEGNDTWESELTSGTYADSSNIFPTASEGFERFVAVDPSALDNGAANAFRSNRDATFIVQDNITTIIYSGSTSDETPDDTVVTLENFNLIEGNSDRIPSLRAGVAFVVATSYPMQLERFEIVNVGGDFEAGDTSGIKADLTISNNNILVVANSGSTEAQNVFVTNSLSADGERTENRISWFGTGD